MDVWMYGCMDGYVSIVNIINENLIYVFIRIIFLQKFLSIVLLLVGVHVENFFYPRLFDYLCAGKTRIHCRIELAAGCPRYTYFKDR